VAQRPGLQEFLSLMALNFEVIVFNNANKEYTQALANAIEGDNDYFSHVLSQEDLTINSLKQEIKNLEIFTKHRSLASIVLVDNQQMSSILQFSNLVPVHQYLGKIGEDQQYLKKLGTYLV